MRAEAGRHEEAADLGLAQAELVVRGEALRPVDQLADAQVGHHRHAHRGVLADLGEPLPVGGEQLSVEVMGNPVQPGAVERPGAGVALVAAHQQPVDLLPPVHQVVRVAQRRQVRAVPLAHRLRDHVLVGHRHDRDPHAGQPADLGRVHAAAVDDDLRLDVALVGADLGDAAPDDVDAGDAGVLVDAHAALAGPGGERVGQL
ncbi:hypothetical protein GCM10018954_050220 [Kutzneria kofuensis]